MKKGTQHALTKSLLRGDRIALAKAITLIESTSSKHQKEAQQLIDDILPHSGKSIRIGITGVPGVGKSTFIEALGTYLIRDKKKKVAVLAVDPSSTISKGSILGDKTRMEQLARSEHAFIRPSPSAQAAGGVAAQTREAILLCEAAGYNVILVETVGVGQSETAVHSIVDFMLLLLLPGAGDELQGMKRGIVELADLIAINKADDNNDQKMKLARAAYKQALALFPPRENQWTTDVLPCSALTGQGIADIWTMIVKFETLTTINKSFTERRKAQNIHWLREEVTALVFSKFSKDARVKKRLAALEKQVAAGKISVARAARELFG